MLHEESMLKAKKPSALLVDIRNQFEKKIVAQLVLISAIRMKIEAIKPFEPIPVDNGISCLHRNPDTGVVTDLQLALRQLDVNYTELNIILEHLSTIV